MKEEIKEGIKEELKDDIVNEIEKRFEKKIDSLREFEEKKQREGNLIIYNLAESIKENAKDREKDDVSECMKIFQEGLNVNQYEIEKIFRLGKSNTTNDKPRPLLVKLKSASDKWNLLRKAKNLRHANQSAEYGTFLTFSVRTISNFSLYLHVFYSEQKEK